MAALRPIQRDEYSRDSSEIEALRLFLVSQGAYRDIPAPVYPRTALGSLTSGRRVGGSMSIRGGSL